MDQTFLRMSKAVEKVKIGPDGEVESVELIDFEQYMA